MIFIILVIPEILTIRIFLVVLDILGLSAYFLILVSEIIKLVIDNRDPMITLRKLCLRVTIRHLREALCSTLFFWDFILWWVLAFSLHFFCMLSFTILFLKYLSFSTTIYIALFLFIKLPPKYDIFPWISRISEQKVFYFLASFLSSHLVWILNEIRLAKLFISKIIIY